MKTCLIIQPGAFGDIILCAPIAKIYSDNGNKVYWTTTSKFKSLIDAFPYVEHILLNDHNLHPDWLRSDVAKILELPLYNDPCIKADLILNLADRGPHSTAQQPNENFEQVKYRLSNIPIKHKHNLNWERNLEKEDKLFNLLDLTPKNYIFAGLTSSRNDRADLPIEDKNIVEVREIDGYSIFDWYKVIINAKAIYCVESAIHQFIDGIIPDVEHIPRFVLSRSTLASGQVYSYSPYWDKTYIK